MARTIFPVVSSSGFFEITAEKTRVSALPSMAQSRQMSLDPKPDRAVRERSAEEQSYLERVQNYIPAEVIAIFIFVNSLIANPRIEDSISVEGFVALASVAVCVVACFVLAKVAAKQAENPAYKLQASMFVVALFIWIYAMDAKVLDVLELEPIPALSGLLLVTFTVFSGLIVPKVAVDAPPEDEEGAVVSPAPQQDVNFATARQRTTETGGFDMTVNQSHYCMCIRNKPGHEQLEGGTRGAILRDAKWEPGARISVSFLGGSDALQNRVKAVAEEWVADGMARLSFRWIDDPAADIRIAFIQGDGSWSYLGTVARDIEAPEPTMNYGWLTDASDDESLRRVVLHEFGHALGMIHEHQNPEGGIAWNEAAVIADLSGPPNNWDLDTTRHNVLNKYDPDAVDATEVDPTSIMMYPIPAAWTDDGFSAGMNNELSDLDRELIREAYP